MAAVLQRQQPLEITEETPLPIDSSPERLDQMLQKQQGVLDEYLSKQVLSTYGIPGVPEKLVFNETDVLPAVSEIGYPVVMKGIAKDIVHKSDKGLIRMGLHSEKDIFAAVSALSEIMNNENQPAAYLIQRQLETSVELIAGMVRDPQFGPCVMCGFGGIFAEILKDSVFAPAPLSRADALKLIGRLKSAELLEGYRGLPPVDRNDLAEILIRLGQLGTDYPRISEIDINPLMVYDQELVAVDATIVLTKDQDRSS
jgi:acetyltransferase